jgi:hypothetical protein
MVLPRASRSGKYKVIKTPTCDLQVENQVGVFNFGCYFNWCDLNTGCHKLVYVLEIY